MSKIFFTRTAKQCCSKWRRTIKKNHFFFIHFLILLLWRVFKGRLKINLHFSAKVFIFDYLISGKSLRTIRLPSQNLFIFVNTSHGGALILILPSRHINWSILIDNCQVIWQQGSRISFWSDTTPFWTLICQSKRICFIFETATKRAIFGLFKMLNI